MVLKIVILCNVYYIYFYAFSDDNWDRNDAKVVCRMLGINALYPKATTKSFHGSRRDNFIMDEVKCIGTEETLEDCPHETKDDCGGTEGAGVICSSNKKFWHLACSSHDVCFR